MRPVCENCGLDLPADETGARVCSYECTFCDGCAVDLLGNVCPNCTGALLPRPPRPTDQLEFAPPVPDRTIAPVDLDAHPGKIAARRTHVTPAAYLWEVVVDCHDPAELARFYGVVFGVTPVVRAADWAYVQPHGRGAHRFAGPPSPFDGVRVAFQGVPEPRSGKVRVHLDVGVDDLDAEVERVVAAGATLVRRVSDDPDGPFAVLADPEGHEFCLVS